MCFHQDVTCSARPGPSRQSQSRLPHGMSCFTTVPTHVLQDGGWHLPTARPVAHSSKELNTDAVTRIEQSAFLVQWCWPMRGASVGVPVRGVPLRGCAAHHPSGAWAAGAPTITVPGTDRKTKQFSCVPSAVCRRSWCWRLCTPSPLPPAVSSTVSSLTRGRVCCHGVLDFVFSRGSECGA